MREAELVLDEMLLLHYVLREVPTRGREKAAYEIAKFEGTKEPTAVYRVSRTARGWMCDCPGFRRRPDEDHKHIEMVKGWIARGKPDPLMTRGFQHWIQSYL